MKRTWRAGIGAAALLAGALGASPVLAKSEPEGQMAASPAFRDAVSVIRARLDAGDVNDAASRISGLSPSGSLEKYMAASLAMELAVKRSDTVAQRSAIAALLESGAVPDAQLPHLNHVAGYLCFQTGAIDNAVVYLTRARALGLKNPQASLLLAEAYVRQRKAGDALQIIDEVIAQQKQAGQPVPASWYDRAAAWAYAQKNWAALARYNAAKVTDPAVAAPIWRSALASYMEGASPDKEAQLDLYRLQAATGAMASERDYQGYAELAAGQGYSAEAKSIIESGISRGKLSKDDRVAASLMPVLNKRAVTYLAAIKGLPGKAEKVSSGAKALQDGDSLLASSQYAEAVPYYRAALSKGGVDRDRASVRLGIALARSGNLADAKVALAQVSGTGSWTQVAAFWSAWVDGRAVQQADATPDKPTRTASAQ